MKKIFLLLFALALALPGFAQLAPLTKAVSENGVTVQKPLYVLRRVSDKFVINPRAISNTTGAPNPGADQEYLPILTETPPDHDALFTVRTQVETTNEVAKQQEIRYVVTNRPKAEMKAAVENAERLQTSQFVSTNDFPRDVTLALAAILRAQKGLELTPDEQSSAEKLVENAVLLSANKANAEAMKAAVEAGQKPDVTAGWAVKVAP